MSSSPNKRKIAEVLAEKSGDIFARIKSGDDRAVIATDLGVYPAQLHKFFCNSTEYRELYRQALEHAQEMQQSQARTAKAKKYKGAVTQADTVHLFASEILDRLADGALVREVARGYEVDHSAIVKYFRADPELNALYQEALTEGGHSLAEMSVEVTAGVALDMVDVKIMETRSNRMAWLAAKRNEQYDNRQSVKHSGTLISSVSIDIGTGE